MALYFYARINIAHVLNVDSVRYVDIKFAPNEDAIGDAVGLEICNALIVYRHYQSYRSNI